ncbi:DUF1127 domain-containing protein [Granulosicoccus sp. 3-233]|uniref:DUF1127 domain-containing protein n=1 Tax=Granulosicoccus sp. 3-233 TaxID=3417969 RepID=UPI003D330171
MATICSEQFGDIAGVRVKVRTDGRTDGRANPRANLPSDAGSRQTSSLQNAVPVPNSSPPVVLRRHLQRFRRWVDRKRDQRESRDAFAHLLALDDTLLQDIGVTRADVERAARLPLTEDAARSLYNATRGGHTRRA